MPFETGNQFWKARSKSGRDKIFKEPCNLREAAEEYFEWVDSNPLMASEAVKFQGEATLTEVPKMRAMTITGLARFLHINVDTWYEYCKRDDFTEITREIEGIIHDQKFTGAAADMLNANIIARDLGLADKKEHSGVDGKPIEHINVDISDEDAVASYMDMIKHND